MRLTKVVTVRTVNLSSPVPDLAAISRAFKPPYETSIHYTDDRNGSERTIEWAIRWTVLPENFAVISCIADFVCSSIDPNSGICSIQMSDFGTPDSLCKTFLMSAQHPLKAGIEAKPCMRTNAQLISLAEDVEFIPRQGKQRSAHSGWGEQSKVKIGV